MVKPRRLVILSAGALALAGCLLFALATLGHADTRRHLDRFIGDVDASDGIDEREADAIAWAYFLGYVSGCGGPDRGTKLVDGYWVIPASSGYAGKPMASPIRIHAQTGAVSQAGGPAFDSFRSFRLILLWGIPIERLKDDLADYWLDNWATPQH